MNFSKPESLNSMLYNPNTGTGRLMKRQQNLVTPQDVTVLDSTAMVGNVLMVEFVIGGHGGQGSPISNTQMAEILQTEGPRLAMDMSAAVNQLFSATRASNLSPTFSVL